MHFATLYMLISVTYYSELYGVISLAIDVIFLANKVFSVLMHEGVYCSAMKGKSHYKCAHNIFHK